MLVIFLLPEAPPSLRRSSSRNTKIKEIGPKVFENCDKLKTVSIPDYFGEIKANAFSSLKKSDISKIINGKFFSIK